MILSELTLDYINGAILDCLAEVYKDVDRRTVRAIERIAQSYEPALRDAFLAAIRSARSQASLDAIAEALQQLNPGAALREAHAGLEYARMRETLADIVEAAGSTATNAIARDVGRVRGMEIAAFDVVNPYAVTYARGEVGMLIREIDRKTLLGIQNLIANGIEVGIPPREAAKQIVGQIGLTEYQTNVALNYETRLLSEGATDIDAKVQRYADKLLRQRSLAIARSETLRAAIGGEQAAWRAAQDQGFLDADAEQVWIVTRDERLCEICRPMPTMPENQHVRIGGMFLTADGRYVKQPPAHVQCRCALGLRT